MSDANQLLLLRKWLVEHAPEDILIPIAPGTKRPTVKYGLPGSWTWASFDEFSAEHAGERWDWSIGLKRLCVVDLDDPSQQGALEASFPALLAAPCERTKRGLHYFFARSPLCDSGEFFDGAAQVSAHLDFKTLCSTGAPGIIVVAPSTDKAWVRAPWDVGAPAPIPPELLLHVARAQGAARAPGPPPRPEAGGSAPRAAPPPPPIAAAVATPDGEMFRLSFAGDPKGAAPLLLPAPRLAKLGFFEPLLSGRWPTGASFQVPCQRALFSTLLAALDSGDLPLDVEPTPALLVALHAAGDQLGAPAPRALLPLGDPAARLGYRADLFDICPAWWRADAEEEARMARGESGVGALLRVDARLAKALLFTPLATAAQKKADGRWLFQAQPCMLAEGNRGRPVLVTDPAAALAAALPRVVAALLKKHAGALVLAGGAVLGAVAQIPPPGADFDLFAHSVTPERADAIAVDVKAAAAAAGYAFGESGCAYNFEPPKGAAGAEGKPFQLVLCLHKDRAQVLESFDLAPAKALARFNEGGALVVEALPAWCEALRAMAFWVDPTAWSKQSVGRICKYVLKGFEVAVPGTRRAAVAPGKSRHSWMDSYYAAKAGAAGGEYESKDPRRSLQANEFGLDALFSAEAEHVFGTLGGGGMQHYSWGEGSASTPSGYTMNPGRLRAADVTAINAAMWGAPPLDVDFAKLPKLKPGGPATREAMATTDSLARRNAVLKAAEQEAKMEGGGGGGGAGGGGGGGGGVAAAEAPEVEWSTVRAVARYAPWDASLSTLHNPKKLAALVDKEAADRAASIVGHPCSKCEKEGAKLFCAPCKGLAGTRVPYCGPECQKADWAEHKKVCAGKKEKAGAK